MGTLMRCGRIRRLTPKECFRLQGFPDELYERAASVNSDSQLYKQAGNAVTATVAYALAMCLPESQKMVKCLTLWAFRVMYVVPKKKGDCIHEN